MTRRRTWAFRLVSAVVLPLAALACLEGVLRLAGAGDDLRFAQPCMTRGANAICDNPRFATRFFPARIARTAPSFSLPADKADGTYRIFVLGGSAAQGDPDPAYGLPRMLRVLLEGRYPGVRFEVVNAAVTATNSHVARVVADELAGHAPDLFVIYAGNNEVVGPFGPGTVFSATPGSLTLVRLGIFLRGTRVGQSVAALTGRFADTEDSPEWRGMEFFLDRRIRRDDPRLDRVYEHLRRNLLATIGASTVPTILSTVGSNLAASAPFASEHRRDLPPAERESFARLLDRGIAEQAAGRTDQALATFEEAERIDETFAELHYRWGRLLLELEHPEEAYDRLARARDLDTLRFRADSRTNETIRDVATRSTARGVRLLDAEELFRREAASGVPGAGLFHDHVHLNFHGTYVLARAALELLDELVPERIRIRADAGEPLSEAQCAERLAFTDFDRRRIAMRMAQRLRQPPFTGQSDHTEQLERLGGPARPDLLETSGWQYLGAIRADDDDPWLRFNHAVLLGEMGRPADAEAQLRGFLTALPHDIQARERLAAALAEQRRFDEAITECRTIIERVPHATAPRYTLGYALANLERYDEAAATYRTLLGLDAGAWEMLYNEIGRLEIRRDRHDAAIATFDEAIHFNERNQPREIPDIHYNRATALKRAGRSDEARAAFGRAAAGYLHDLERGPGSVTLLMALGRSLAEAGDLEGAETRFREATELQPTNAAAQDALVRTIAATGDVEEALAVGSRAVDVLRAAGRSADADRLSALLQTLESR